MEKTLESPLTARRSNQSILKEISPECSLEGLMLKLKLQNFGYLMQRTDSFEKIWIWEQLKAGGEGHDKGWDSWMALLTQWTWVWVNSTSWWWTGRPGMLQSTGSQRVRHDWVTELKSLKNVYSNQLLILTECLFIDFSEVFVYFIQYILLRYMIWKCFLPSGVLSFHFLDSVLWSTKVFHFDEVQVIYVFLGCLCCRFHTYKTIT